MVELVADDTELRKSSDMSWNLSARVIQKLIEMLALVILTGL